MNLLKIKIQSQSDLITNSSSELFQLRTDDTVEQVNEILTQITTGFEYPVLFSYEDYKKNKNKYKEFCKSIEDYDYEKDWGKIENFQKENLTSYIYNIIQGWFFDEDDPEKELYVYKEYLCADAYTDAKMDNLQKEFQIYVLQNNYIDDEYRRYPLNTYRVHEEAFTNFIATHKLPPAKDLINDWTYYYGNIKDLDGSILVLSKDENSIPYETWNDIREIFKETENYHLG